MQSNHCRQTAAAAARNGFACTLVLTGDKPPKPSGNNFLDLFLGAQIVWAGGADRDLVLQQTYEQTQSKGRKPYLIPYGGSNPIGALGYVYALKEMLEQVDDLDWIVFPSSSGGTHAGLALGGRMFNFKGKILGISIDNPAFELSEKVARLAEETAQGLDIEQSFKPQDILVNDDYFV